MKEPAAELTPLMKQYWEVKKAHADKFLFFRMGDFYELFYEDALRAAPLLGITLTRRNKNSGDETPMCGMPHHSIANYINKLLKLGHRVALCDQLEDPRQAKGIVKRGVTRILSPGMVYDPESLEDPLRPNYMMSFCTEAISFLDATTGECFYYNATDDRQRHEICAILRPVEWVGTERVTPSPLLKDFFEQNLLNEICHEATQGPLEWPVSAQRLYSYALTLQGDALRSTLRNFEEKLFQRNLYLSSQVFLQLEVFESQAGDPRKTLFSSMNRTKTPGGARLLRQWLKFPLRDLTEITRRQERVSYFMKDSQKLQEIRVALAQLFDVERRIGKLSLPTVNGRDLQQLAYSLRAALLLKHTEPFPAELSQIVSTATHLSEKVLDQLREELPLAIKEGRLFRQGLRPELDELIEASEGSSQLLLALEQKERESSGISSLKVKYNNVFGYFFEVTNTHLQKVPAHFVRKQTLANAERFITEELQQLETKILSSDLRRCELEYEMFTSLREECLRSAREMLMLSVYLNELDVLTGLAWVALEQNYARPQFRKDRLLSLKSCRHPVVEQFSKERFVANDLELNGGHCLLLTGPNMAGKSTLMRQVALIVLMAHIGSFVSAEAAQLPLFDKIFTRIGASDQLANHLSTFMVEMKEVAEMLREATQESLLIFDEVGRGTSTYDGMSLAQAILEWTVQELKPTVMFATHYHELTYLEKENPKIENAHLAIHEEKSDLRFLYTLKKGPVERSFGVEVAKLAGLPSPVLQRAKKLLGEHEAKKRQVLGQLNLFESL